MRQDPPGRNRQNRLRISLPLAARSRYPCAWKMAYFSTAAASERRNPTGKSRVWDFFRFSNETHPANRRQPAQPRRKIRPTAMKTVSGIPYWPSRDPIGEEGGVNLYGLVGNDGVKVFDYLGLKRLSMKYSILKEGECVLGENLSHWGTAIILCSAFSMLSCKHSANPHHYPSAAYSREAYILSNQLMRLTEKSPQSSDSLRDVVRLLDISALERGPIKKLYLGLDAKVNAFLIDSIGVMIGPDTDILAVIEVAGPPKSQELWQVWPVVRKIADYSDWRNGVVP